MKRILAASFILSFPLLLIWRFKLLSPDKISIDLNNSHCVSAREIQSATLFSGLNILMVGQDKLKSKLVEKYPCVGNVDLKYIFPKEIKITVNRRTPIFQLVSLRLPPKINLLNSEASASSMSALLDWSFPNATDEVLVVDKSGVIFSTEVLPSLPTVLLTDERLKIGQKVDEKLVTQLVIILDKLNETKRSSPEIFQELQLKVEKDYILINSYPRIALSLSEDLLKQLGSLQLILGKAKIDGRSMDLVDLRFDKPVVIYGKR